MTDEKGGNFVDGAANYAANMEADRQMALTHMNQDLQQALLNNGYGLEGDWKCIGNVVADCMKKQYNWTERRIAENFHDTWWNPGIVTGIPNVRDDMRKNVIVENPTLPPIVEGPPHPRSP